MASAEDRVAAGIAYAESNFPPGWREKIDPATLDIRSAFGCVFGQVFGSARVCGYDIGCEQTGLDYEQRIDLGFTSRKPTIDPDWDALTAAWRAALAPDAPQ